MRCEICEKAEGATWVCAGLDVPMLYFCEKHGREHEAECPDVKNGRSRLTNVGSNDRGKDDG